MSAGTLTLTNNSALVGGSGTAFATELAAGDFIVATVGGIAYTLPVKSLESATSLTLISNYPGPTQSGIAWSAVPRAAQNQITAALVAQTTEALRGLNSDKQNWQAVFSDSGDITVILPDGSSFTGPSWKKIADRLASIDQDAIQSLASQVKTDAQQVAADRLDVDNKAAQVSADAVTASSAASAAVTANTAAQSAKTDAVAAKVAAEAARDAAQSANPDNQVKKENNLSDLADISTARNNLSVYSKAEVDGVIAATGSWIAMTLNSGWTVNTSSDSTARAVYRIKNGYLEVHANVVGPGGYNAGGMVTLPAGYRPANMYSMRCVGSSTDTTWMARVTIRPSGEIYIDSATLSAGLYIYFRIPLL